MWYVLVFSTQASILCTAFGVSLTPNIFLSLVTGAQWDLGLEFDWTNQTLCFNLSIVDLALGLLSCWKMNDFPQS